MKTELTIDQSSRLVELGIDASKASASARADNMGIRVKGIVMMPPKPIFTLSDLLSIVPKWIKHRYELYWLCIRVDRYEEMWCADYRGGTYDCDEADTYQEGEELIDCLYKMLCWLIEKNYYKPNKQ